MPRKFRRVSAGGDCGGWSFRKSANWLPQSRAADVARRADPASFAERDEISKQLEWETENAAASRIQSIFRFKMEMRRKKQILSSRRFSAAGAGPQRTNAVITIQRAAKKKWQWQPEVSDAMKFKMFQAMEREKFDNKLGR